MRLSSVDILQDIVTPCLQYLNLYNKQLAVFLTAVQVIEHSNASSNTFSTYRISHDQHWQVWDHYLVRHPELASEVRGMASQHRFLSDPDQELNFNSGYATAIAAMLLYFQAQKANKTLLGYRNLTRLWLNIHPYINQSALAKKITAIELQLQKSAA